MEINLTDLQKRRLTNGVIAVVFILAIFLGLKALNTIKEFRYIGSGVYPTNTITVNGKGEVFAIPDVASLSFSVVEEGKTVADAQAKATKKMNSILDSLSDMDIEDKDIKTIGYSSNPKYEYQQNSGCAVGYCPPGKEVLLGYEVSQTISLKIRKTDKAGDVLTKVGSLGASNISGLNFIVDDMEAAQKEARDKAVADAREQAKAIAKSLGLKLGGVIGFNEQGNYPPMYYGMGGAMESKVMSMDASIVAPQLPVGENEIVSNVSVTYEVR